VIDTANNEMDLVHFEKLIRDKCGLFFDDQRSSILADSIRRQMSMNGLDSHEEYLRQLRRDQNELRQLINRLTINETYYLREPTQLKVFSERVVPETLLSKAPGDKVTIVSAGCSTGEEAYSLAMVLTEKYGAVIEGLFDIVAIDVDSEAIAIAQNGIFGGHSFRGFDPRLKQTYFERVGKDAYKVKDLIKRMVAFYNFNLLSDYYPKFLQDVDVVFYRNVSIYFDSETKTDIFRKLAQILNDGGYLFLGSSETIPHDVGVLSLIEFDGTYLYHKDPDLKADGGDNICFDFARQNRNKHIETLKPLNSDLQGLKLKLRANKLLKQRKGETKKNPDEDFSDALSLVKNGQYQKAVDILDKIISETPLYVRAHELKAGILIKLEQPEEAQNICLKIIQKDQWRLESNILLGLIARMQNEEDQAIKRFKAALYIKSSCWPAHFYLAEICRLRSKFKQACREYGIVIRLLESGQVSDPEQILFPFLIAPQEMIGLCHHHLSKLKRQMVES